MEQPVELGDILQGEQARAISFAARNLATEFGKETNGGTHKKGVTRDFPDGSKLAVAVDISGDASLGEVTALYSVFVRNTEVEVVGTDRVKKKVPGEERTVTRIVFSDGQIVRFRKGNDIVVDGCSEPVQGSETRLLDSDLNTIQKAITSFSETLEAERAQHFSPRAHSVRRLFQALRSRL